MSAYLWPLSRTTVLDLNGDVSPGALLNFWVAATTTPLVTYQDSALTTPHPNVIAADAAGRLPAIYMHYTDYRQRLRTAGGTLLFDDDGIANPAPATSGGGGSVPADQLIQTGDIIPSLSKGSRAGFVELNGDTIGNAGSGATGRANADCEALFIVNWDRFDNTICPVSGGRGGSGATDFAAGKTLQLIDGRNKGFFGLDDMGNSAAGGFSGVTFAKGNATTAGSSGGVSTHALTVAQLAAHPHGIALTPGFNDVYTKVLAQTTLNLAPGATPVQIVNAVTTDTTPNSIAINGNTANAGSGEAHPNMPPFLLGTWYQKL